MKYTSQQQQIHRPAEIIYTALSNFSNFTPVLADKVDQWQATSDTCSFMAQGFKLGLRIGELTPYTTIKITSDDQVGAPFPFTFWLQLKQEESNDTRLRIVMDVELNMMMKMMLGGKIQDAIDKIAQQIAHAFNNAHI